MVGHPPLESLPAQPGSRTSAPHLRVLVVDDNRDAADMLSLLLVLAGHEVRTVYDGDEAVRTAVAFRPEAVLLDIGLPGLDGYEVARQLRRLAGLHDALVIAVTGYGGEDYRGRSQEAGFDHHLVKPCSLEELQRLFAAGKRPARLGAA